MLITIVEVFNRSVNWDFIKTLFEIEKEFEKEFGIEIEFEIGIEIEKEFWIEEV